VINTLAAVSVHGLEKFEKNGINAGRQMPAEFHG
jgi:hypothetical protein